MIRKVMGASLDLDSRLVLDVSLFHFSHLKYSFYHAKRIIFHRGLVSAAVLRSVCIS